MFPHMLKIDTPFLDKSISPFLPAPKRGQQPDLTAAAWHLGWWKLLTGLSLLPANRCVTLGGLVFDYESIRPCSDWNIQQKSKTYTYTVVFYIIAVMFFSRNSFPSSVWLCVGDRLFLENGMSVRRQTNKTQETQMLRNTSPVQPSAPKGWRRIERKHLLNLLGESNRESVY